MKGFTLLETILALLILSIFVGSIIWSLFWIFERSDFYESRKKVEEEALFLNQKINWILDNSEILSPLANTTSTFLQVNKKNFSQNPITLKWQSYSVLISYANGENIPLTSNNIKVTYFEVKRDNFAQGDRILVKINLESAILFRTFEKYQTSLNLVKFLPK